MREAMALSRVSVKSESLSPNEQEEPEWADCGYGSLVLVICGFVAFADLVPAGVCISEVLENVAPHDEVNSR